mmetsp:Transcript_43393/g.90355  ORF Transcript_43393/g.90355 Transcript_43393/m.90355 type:complete len:462 (+) Transcript_43393:2513-3898(+)
MPGQLRQDLARVLQHEIVRVLVQRVFGNLVAEENRNVVVGVVLGLAGQQDVTLHILGDFFDPDGLLGLVKCLLERLVRGQGAVEILEEAVCCLVTKNLRVVAANDVGDSRVDKGLPDPSRMIGIHDYQLERRIRRLNQRGQRIYGKAIVEVTLLVFKGQYVTGISVTREMQNPAAPRCYGRRKGRDGSSLDLRVYPGVQPSRTFRGALDYGCLEVEIVERDRFTSLGSTDEIGQRSCLQDNDAIPQNPGRGHFGVFVIDRRRWLCHLVLVSTRRLRLVRVLVAVHGSLVGSRRRVLHGDLPDGHTALLYGFRLVPVQAIRPIQRPLRDFIGDGEVRSEGFDEGVGGRHGGPLFPLVFGPSFLFQFRRNRIEMGVQDSRDRFDDELPIDLVVVQSRDLVEGSVVAQRVEEGTRTDTGDVVLPDPEFLKRRVRFDHSCQVEASLVADPVPAQVYFRELGFVGV